MGKNRKKRAYDTYTKMKEKMPDATPDQLEMAVRKYLMRKKMNRVGFCFVIALICYFMLGIPPLLNSNSDIVVWICHLLNGLQSISIIVGVMIFAKSMHDPLTPFEAQEFEERE